MRIKPWQVKKGVEFPSLKPIALTCSPPQPSINFEPVNPPSSFPNFSRAFRPVTGCHPPSQPPTRRTVPRVPTTTENHNRSATRYRYTGIPIRNCSTITLPVGRQASEIHQHDGGFRVLCKKKFDRTLGESPQLGKLQGL